MSADALPDGLMTLIKSAVRAQITAMAVPGSTGPERVEHLTGVSRGQISRWQGDAYRDLPSIEVIFILEHISQKPVISRALAQLSGHRLTPIADEDAPHACFVAEMVELAGTSAGVVAEISAGMLDGVMTPAEAKRALVRAAAHQDALTRTTRKLSTVATANDRG